MGGILSYACAPLIDGMGRATPSATSLPCHAQLTGCVIVSGFRVVLDLDTYPFSNLICPRCAERAKPGRGKPELIMNISFFACFHAISPERSGFSKITTFFYALVALKLLVSLISRLVACSARIVSDKQTDRHTEQLL